MFFSFEFKFEKKKMFLSFLFISISNFENKEIPENLLQEENTPSFQTLPEDDGIFKLEGRLNRDTTLSSGQENGGRVHEYYVCSLTLNKNINFEGNWAFGTGIAAGSGGAIFLSASTLTTTISSTDTENEQKLEFNNNKAAVGGAICSLASAIFMQKPVFKSNTAFKYAGAIYFQGLFNSKDGYHDSFVMILDEAKFYSNIAKSVGGAISFSIAHSTTIQNCDFVQNQAGISGGAIYSINCPLSIFKSNFVNNIASSPKDEANPTNTLFPNHHNFPDNPDTPKTELFQFAPAIFRGRGGGAVYFLSDEEAQGIKLPSPKKKELITNKCCFQFNYAFRSTSSITSKNPNGGPGNDIMLDGDILYTSNSDNFDTTEGSISVYERTKDLTQLKIFSSTQLKDNQCISDLPSDISTQTTDYPTESSISFKESNSNTKTDTSYVPSPTTYIYCASPITRLPYKTTSSWYATANLDFSKFQSKEFPINTGDDFTLFTPLTPPAQTQTPTNTNPEQSRTSEDDSSVSEQDSSSTELTPSPLPTQIQTYTISISIDPAKPTTQSTTYSWSTISNSKTFTLIPTSYGDGDNPQTTYTWGETITDIWTLVPTQIFTNLQEEAPIEDEDSSNLGLIIGIVAGILVLLIIIGILIWFILFKRNKEAQSTSSVEMPEETVVQIHESINECVTNDNPLWTTSVMGDTDDPFKNDFEEQLQTGFFDSPELEDLK